MRGGQRKGAGRKLGSITSDRTEKLGERLTEEEKTKLKSILKQLRGEKID